MKMKKEERKKTQIIRSKIIFHTKNNIKRKIIQIKNLIFNMFDKNSVKSSREIAQKNLRKKGKGGGREQKRERRERERER